MKKDEVVLIKQEIEYRKKLGIDEKILQRGRNIAISKKIIPNIGFLLNWFKLYLDILPLGRCLYESKNFDLYKESENLIIPIQSHYSIYDGSKRVFNFNIETVYKLYLKRLTKLTTRQVISRVITRPINIWQEFINSLDIPIDQLSNEFINKILKFNIGKEDLEKEVTIINSKFNFNNSNQINIELSNLHQFYDNFLVIKHISLDIAKIRGLIDSKSTIDKIISIRKNMFI